MPAKKAARQSLKRYQRNRGVRSATRTALTRAHQSIQSGNADQAELAVREAISDLDRAVRKGVLHKNNASRRKSRLAVKLNRMQDAAPAS